MRYSSTSCYRWHNRNYRNNLLCRYHLPALGTPVTLMGENGGASITATEVAEKRGTINYEVLCLLSDRVPRSYD